MLTPYYLFHITWGQLMSAEILARIQFAFTIMYHMVFPVLTIGLAAYLVIMEALWLKTRDRHYYGHCRFWGSIFLLNFAMGVVTGVVMEFQFGMNWAAFSRITGDFFGNVIGFEAAMAFAVEAAFLAIMIFGWHRVTPAVHLFATSVVAIGAIVSAFWIMDASSWMQTPAGVVMDGGRIAVTSYRAAIFNPAMGVSFLHMILACIEISLFVVGGLSAWYILNRQHTAFFITSFKAAVIAAIVCTPLQMYVGDASGRAVVRLQPAKAAAMEAHWDTNAPGKGASFALVAWPSRERERNAFAIEVPYLLSFLSTRTFTGTVQGLREFPPQDRPPILLPFYTFRIMAGLGTLMMFLMFWTLWAWWKGGLAPRNIEGQKWLLWGWIAAVPCSYVAMEAGWAVREVGRQPWVVYGLLRTDQAGSVMATGPVLASMIMYAVLYAALFAFFLVYLGRIIRKGPDIASLPAPPGDYVYAGDGTPYRTEER